MLAAVLWLLSVSLASLVSASFLPKVEGGIPNLDKLVHAVFYMVATLLLYMHYRKSQAKGLLIRIAGFCLVYGIIIEVLQYSLPYERAFEWADMLANATGIILAIILIKFVLAPRLGLKDKI
ncbi:VanZ family protein [Robertkochia sediminum]|uniref:VanZ family protein n=1 Tax=Robertkochia sediminum TaxID=2785326 RepID=UPI001931FF98|nr:VanZ family protein [Robertkochia sediminum]MBL7471987.1 VanZ family protein [Robertkochia sediminum]